jgi:hypothetical protein
MQTESKSRPILFKGDDIRAILGGHKTMTRHVVKGAPTTAINHRLISFEGGWNWQVDQKGVASTLHRELEAPLACPFGQVGDLLHVENECCARFLLEITDVRIERLNEISRGDSMSEGCPFQNIANQTDPKQWFIDIWQSINGEESWASNPYVFVIEFRVVTA